MQIRVRVVAMSEKEGQKCTRGRGVDWVGVAPETCGPLQSVMQTNGLILVHTLPKQANERQLIVQACQRSILR